MALFTRSGQETLPVGTDDKGRPYYVYQVCCGRCGGAGGLEQWRHTGFTCFECGGSGGKRNVRAQLYTAEQLAKLNATQAKRQATAAAKRAKKDAERAAEAKVQAEAWIAANRALYDGLCEFSTRNDFIADMLANISKWGCLTEAQEKAAQKSIDKTRADIARAANARYLGNIGERVEITITVEKTIDITPPDSRFGRRWLYICHDENGNAIIYRGNSWSMPTEGQTGKIKATVEEHAEYRGLKQTIISRPSAPKEQKAAA